MSIEPYASKRNFLPPPQVFIWANAIMMLIGIFVLGWSARAVVIAYFFETIIIGIIHILKMTLVAIYGKKDQDEIEKKNGLQGPGLIPFFLFHYFFFIFVQSVFVFMVVGIETPGEKDSFHVFRNYAWELSQKDTQEAVMAMFVANLGVTIFQFIIPGKFKTTTLNKLFFQPYLRIFIQQFVVLISGFFFVFAGGEKATAVILIILRLAIDLALQNVAGSRKAKEKWLKRLTKKSDDPDKDREQLESLMEQ